MLQLLLLASLAAAQDDPLGEISTSLAHFVDATEVQSLISHLDAQAVAVSGRLGRVGPSEEERVQAALYRQVANNLGAKVVLDELQDLPMDAERIRRTVVEYEAFKLQTYVSSGVFPKRYFGYFDLDWDTAHREWDLRQTVRCSTRVINAWAEEEGRPLRVDDAEIAVTFIAEGGAILLREDQHRMDDLHPVFDVGLDDVAKGTADLPGLLERLDRACGTDAGGLVVYTEPGVQPPGATDRLASHDGQWGWLVRSATFEEGIVGTALMWAWEKEIAARKLASSGGGDLYARDREDQFILGSLVYNSGLLHSASTHRRIRDFSAGGLVYGSSEKNAHRRPRLNLLAPPELLAEVLEVRAYRQQPTSWLAAYHILQRYGAWEALRRFTDVFDDGGMFSPAVPPPGYAPPPKGESPHAPERGPHR